jgi:hypothetical protein
MRNSFVERKEISPFRKITTSWYAVVICRYESLQRDNRFVMKQNHNHESDQINCFYYRLFHRHNSNGSKQHSFFRYGFYPLNEYGQFFGKKHFNVVSIFMLSTNQKRWICSVAWWF